MNNDIVTRLREEHTGESNGIVFRFGPTKDELEAADEIERLWEMLKLKDVLISQLRDELKWTSDGDR